MSADRGAFRFWLRSQTQQEDPPPILWKREATAKGLTENNWSSVLYDSSFSTSPSAWTDPEQQNWASVVAHAPLLQATICSHERTPKNTLVYRCQRKPTRACRHAHATVNDDQMWESDV